VENRTQRQPSLPTSSAPSLLTLRVATRAVSMASAAASAVNRATSQRRDASQAAARVPPGGVLAVPPASSRSNESEALPSSRTAAASCSSGAPVPTHTTSVQLPLCKEDEVSRRLGPEKHAEGNLERDSTHKAESAKQNPTDVEVAKQDLPVRDSRSAALHALMRAEENGALTEAVDQTVAFHGLSDIQEAARCALVGGHVRGLLRPAISRALGEGNNTSPEQAVADAAREALSKAHNDGSLLMVLARALEESPELQDKDKAIERLQQAFFEHRDRGLSPNSAALEILRR